MSVPFGPLLVGPFAPDLPDYANPGSTLALNVIPGAISYRPHPSLAVSTDALDARAQGCFYARQADGSAAIFAGTATKLYKLSGTTWNDVSRVSGGDYACPADGFWQFVQFGSLVIAVNGADVAQVFDIESDSNFSALSGSPPASPKFIAVVGDFVVVGHDNNGNTSIDWSGINDATTWAASATTLADGQILPDGGRITGIVGGQYGIIIQERAIRRMSFIGAPLVFQFDKIHEAVGGAIDYCAAAAPGERVFFVDRAGPYMLQGDALNPIGAQRVDRSFWNHTTYGIDQTFLNRTSIAVNPVEKFVAISVVSAGNDTPDTLWLYQWELDRWSIVRPGEHEMIASIVTQTGLTLEDLDALYATLEDVPFSLDSYVWTGVARPVMAGFLTDHTEGYFTGAALEATVDTTEGNLFQGRKGEVQWARALVDGGAPTIAIGTRANLTDAVSWGTAKAVNAADGRNGNFRSLGRYHRARITIPAGATWEHLQGITDIQAVARGMR